MSAEVMVALHELDPIFRRVTLQNERMKAVARDLAFHRYPLGKLSTLYRNILILIYDSSVAVYDHL